MLAHRLGRGDRAALDLPWHSGTVRSVYDRLVDPMEPRDTGGVGFELVYRYTDRAGLLKYLLPSGELRMNSWSQMNDPREAKSWQLVGPWSPSGSLSQAEVRIRVDDLVRRSARLLSTSRDRAPQDEDSRGYLFHRGWAKSPLWHHYSFAHSGACLVLDLGELNANLAGMSPTSSRRWRGIGSVTYEDRPAKVELSGIFANRQDVDDAIENYLDRKGMVIELHLQKTTEWKYENEARLICVDFDLPAGQFDKPIDGLPVGEALKAVILGEAHVDPLGSANQIRSQLGSDVAVMQCHWTDGKPRLGVL
jgi:Protein of unknown function (DUF2971)